MCISRMRPAGSPGCGKKEARDFRPGLGSSAPQIGQRPNQLKRQTSSVEINPALAKLRGLG